MSSSLPTTASHLARRALIGVALAGALLMAACGVEVPEDVADRASSTQATTEASVTTTEAPRSDDELEQALLDNGYTEDEAQCGAENLRDDLDADEIDEVIGADDIEEIDPRTAADFGEAISECLDDGSDDEGPGADRGPGG